MLGICGFIPVSYTHLDVYKRPGAGITLTVIRAMNQLGPAKAALLIVIAQLIVAYGIELLGLFGVDKEPLEWRKVIGMGIALIGIAIFQWK